MVILKTYEFPQLAHLDKGKLADEGIDAFVQDDNMATVAPLFSQAIGGVKLLVAIQDVERARTILGLNEFALLKDTFDEEIAPQRVCPSCGSIEVFQKRSILSGIAFLVLFFVPVATWTHKYHCVNCDHEWKDNN